MFDRDRQLTADQFNTEFEVLHQDGSYFRLPLAFVEEDDEVLYVYTEHTGFFLFYKEDLESWGPKAN